MVQQNETLTVGLAQIAPVWLKKDETIEKVISWMDRAAQEDCRLVVFGEALLPGYPFWLSHTGGAHFNDATQKQLFAWYAKQSVCIEDGDLRALQDRCAQHNMTLVVGCVERAPDRGGHSLYCSMVTVNDSGQVINVHRKLMPTYEERLVWSPGDGAGLRTFSCGPFTVGGLNCWENWMPMARSSLYAQGENCHIAIWPGSIRNTEDITRFIAKESRSYVLSVSGLLKSSGIPGDIPHTEAMDRLPDQVFADGGSCLAAPNGSWVIEPADEQEQLLTATIDLMYVREERQNFDPSGHYSRPDVLQLTLNPERQSTLRIEEPSSR